MENKGYADFDDKELVVKYLDGDIYAADELIKRSYDHLKRFLTYKDVPYSFVEDIAQETFFKVLESLRAGLFNPEKGDFRNWLFTVGWRTYLDSTKRKKLNTIKPIDNDFDPVAIVADKDNFEKDLHDKQFRRAVKDVILDLSEELASIAMLHWYIGKTLADTAIILGIPEGTVKSRMQIVKRELRKRTELYN